MRTSSTSSSSRLSRLPWAGLLALGLLLALDRAVLGFGGAWGPLVVEDPNSAADTRLALQELRARPPGRPRVVVAGTSQVIDGFDQPLAESLLPGAAFAKLGNPRFEPFALRALADDLVVSRADAVVLMASEQDTHRPLRLEPVPGASTASLGALWDLLSVTDWRFAVENRTSLYRLVATSGLLAYRYRPELRLAGPEWLDSFRLDDRIPSQQPRGDPFRPVALWGARHHRIRAAAERSTFDLFPPLGDPFKQRIQAGTLQEITAGSHVAVQKHLFRRMLEVLRDAGVEVVIVEGVMHPATRDFYDPALRDDFAAFARQLESELGAVFVSREELPRLAESDFYDVFHTNRRGRAKLTRAMLRGLRETGIDWGVRSS